MAGIAGVQGTDSGGLELMMEKISYRGPDRTWIDSRQGVNIGCLELEIGGNCNGRAQHYAKDGSLVVVLDGRIYNAETQDLTDADAVLHFYKKFGPL